MGTKTTRKTNGLGIEARLKLEDEGGRVWENITKSKWQQDLSLSKLFEGSWAKIESRRQ